MRRTSFAEMHCPIARTLEIVGEWWSLLIIRDAFRGVRRFDDFQRSSGIARNVLSARLATLVQHCILERSPYQEHPERHEYRLTARGRDLYPVIVGLLRWGERWGAEDLGPTVILTHKACGRDGLPELTCAGCHVTVEPTDMRWRWTDAVPAEQRALVRAAPGSEGAVTR